MFASRIGLEDGHDFELIFHAGALTSATSLTFSPSGPFPIGETSEILSSCGSAWALPVMVYLVVLLSGFFTMTVNPTSTVSRFSWTSSMITAWSTRLSRVNIRLSVNASPFLASSHSAFPVVPQFLGLLDVPSAFLADNRVQVF